jgi:hypothetical protein
MRRKARTNVVHLDVHLEEVPLARPPRKAACDSWALPEPLIRTWVAGERRHIRIVHVGACGVPHGHSEVRPCLLPPLGNGSVHPFEQQCGSHGIVDTGHSAQRCKFLIAATSIGLHMPLVACESVLHSLSFAISCPLTRAALANMQRQARARGTHGGCRLLAT